MLLQSRRDLIEVFPAIPKGWKDVAFTTLRAEGGVLVSAEMRDGKTVRIEVTSDNQTDCRLRSTEPEREWVLHLAPGEKRVLAP